jgi:hypothetical protein
MFASSIGVAPVGTRPKASSRSFTCGT